MGVYKSIENGEPLRNKTIPCEAIQPLGGDKIKKCIVCGKLLPLKEFHKNSANKDGYDNRCKHCKSIIAHNKRENDYFRQYCITKRSECKRKNIPFDLDASYLEEIWTGECPIFHISLCRNHKGRGSSYSAHLDRFDPNKGYIKGNVTWISGRANRIKYDASIEELRQIVDWMERVTTIPKGSTSKQREVVDADNSVKR